MRLARHGGCRALAIPRDDAPCDRSLSSLWRRPGLPRVLYFPRRVPSGRRAGAGQTRAQSRSAAGASAALRQTSSARRRGHGRPVPGHPRMGRETGRRSPCAATVSRPLPQAWRSPGTPGKMGGTRGLTPPETGLYSRCTPGTGERFQGARRGPAGRRGVWLRPACRGSRDGQPDRHRCLPSFVAGPSRGDAPGRPRRRTGCLVGRAKRRRSRQPPRGTNARDCSG